MWGWPQGSRDTLAGVRCLLLSFNLCGDFSLSVSGREAAPLDSGRGWTNLYKAPSPSLQHPLYKTLEELTGLSWANRSGQWGPGTVTGRTSWSLGRAGFQRQGDRGWDGNGCRWAETQVSATQGDCSSPKGRNVSRLCSSRQGQCRRKGPQKHVPTTSQPPSPKALSYIP